MSSDAGSALAPEVDDGIAWVPVADTASLQVLRHLVASVDAVPVLILGSYRQTDLDGEHPLTALLADLHRQPGVTRIRRPVSMESA